MPHYTDRLSFTRSRGSYFRVAGLRGVGTTPGARPRRLLPVPHRTAAAIGGRYPLLLRYPPPTLLLFRVISTFRYALRKRDFKTARDRSRAAQERLSITGFDFACNVAIIFEVKFSDDLCAATHRYTFSRTSGHALKCLIINYAWYRNKSQYFTSIFYQEVIYLNR